MATAGAYIGVNNVAKKIKKGYIGVGGVARKIKKGYIGVDGKARLCYSGIRIITAAGTVDRPHLNYSGSIGNFAPGTIGDYAVFDGGQWSSDGYYTCSNQMYYWNSSFTRKQLSTLSREQHNSANVGNYMLIGGGVNYESYYTAVRAYDSSMTFITAPELNSERGTWLSVSTANRALFMGISTTINSYDASLTKRTSETGMRLYWMYSDTTSFNGEALVVPGGVHSDTTYTTTVYRYNDSLTQTQLSTGLSTAMTGAGATTNGPYALIGGGKVGQTYDSEGYPVSSLTSTVDAFNRSFTRSSTSLSTNKHYAGRYYNRAFDIKDYGVFILGGQFARCFDAFNDSLVRTTVTGLNYGNNGLYSPITNKEMFIIFNGHIGGGIEQYPYGYCYKLV